MTTHRRPSILVTADTQPHSFTIRMSEPTDMLALSPVSSGRIGKQLLRWGPLTICQSECHHIGQVTLRVCHQPSVLRFT